jgi:uncharacterized membrane protein
MLLNTKAYNSLMSHVRRLLNRTLKALATHSTGFFIITAMVFGTIMCFRVTPLFGSDEIVHFPRAFYVQDGHMWADHLDGYDYGGYVPKQIKEFNDAYREQVQSPQVDANKLQEIKARYSHERLNNNSREPLAFTSASLSAGWDYLPPAAGIWAARTLNLPLNWYVYLGRLFTLATYILLVYFAIKYLPFGKRFLLLIALLPVALVQGGTIGMDGLVNGLSWLIIALTFAVLVKKLSVTPKLLAVTLLLSLLLSTTKQGYAPIAALPLLIPARLFTFDLRRVWLWRIFFGGALLLLSLWYLGATSPIAAIIHNVQRPGLHVDEAGQLHYIFQHPLLFLSMIFIQPFTIWAASIYAGMVGVLTNRLVYLPIPLIVLLFVMMLITSLHKERLQVDRRDRLYLVVCSIGIFLATFILINLALYLSFTQVGYPQVEGLQGRYFLPLLPLLGVIVHIAMPKLFLKISDIFMSLVLYPILIFSLILTTMVIH